MHGDGGSRLKRWKNWKRVVFLAKVYMIMKTICDTSVLIPSSTRMRLVQAARENLFGTSIKRPTRQFKNRPHFRSIKNNQEQRAVCPKTLILRNFSLPHVWRTESVANFWRPQGESHDCKCVVLMIEDWYYVTSKSMTAGLRIMEERLVTLHCGKGFYLHIGRKKLGCRIEKGKT